MPIANISDLVRLRQSLEWLQSIPSVLTQLDAPALQRLTHDFDPLTDLFQLLEGHILPEPNLKVKEGGYINHGVNQQLDRLKSLMRDGKQHIANMEAKEQRETEIKGLKIKHNRVFGFYIEISNVSKHLVPKHYIRKQTLVNCERYVTDELKELEESILSAEEESKVLELEIYEQIKQDLQKETARIQEVARRIAELDVLMALANNAQMHNYTRPLFHQNGAEQRLEIIEGRHPVIESMHFDEPFIPNDLELNTKDRYILVITGPNMGGKSTFMRQKALIALMAQIGSYVPAQRATLPLFDRIFTRVGASDNLTKGQSTFMVEMSEAASILNNATKKSLIILDEIGRGTSTFDGISLAWAIIEHLHQLGAMTLFATHYHELVLLEEQLNGVVNAKVVVREEQENVVFLRKVIDGQADKIYGIQVARLAGLPLDVVQRAKDVLKKLEVAERRFNSLEEEAESAFRENPPSYSKQAIETDIPVVFNTQLSFLPDDSEIVQEIRALDLINTTPLQAFEFLQQLKKKL